MLENWCYESEPLLLMSGHVDDHSQKMPADLLQSIIDSKKANAGVFNKRQCILGLFDQVRLEATADDQRPAVKRADDQRAGRGGTGRRTMTARFSCTVPSRAMSQQCMRGAAEAVATNGPA